MADVYDDWYAGDDTTATNAVTALRLLAGAGPVLELGAGTGRLAIPLAASGLEVHALDASAAMLRRLQVKPGGTAVTLHVGDMAAGLPDLRFTLVFIAVNTLFNVTSADDQQALFRAVAARLAPAGRFVVEAFVPALDQDTSAVEVREIAADRVVLAVSRSDAATQRVDGQFVELTESGGVRLRPWSIRWATVSQLDEMARAAGLVVETRWAGWDGAPFTPASDNHVTIYRVA
jgi:SAM-dependent methyltransferase